MTRRGARAPGRTAAAVAALASAACSGGAQLPREIDEAALVDGASYLDDYRRVIRPLSPPIVVTIPAFSFIARWNDIFGPLIHPNSPKQMTIAVGLLFFKGDQDSLIRLLLAASTLTRLPIVPVQRYAVRSIMMTGLEEG